MADSDIATVCGFAGLRLQDFKPTDGSYGLTIFQLFSVVIFPSIHEDQAPIIRKLIEYRHGFHITFYGNLSLTALLDQVLFGRPSPAEPSEPHPWTQVVRNNEMATGL